MAYYTTIINFGSSYNINSDTGRLGKHSVKPPDKKNYLKMNIISYNVLTRFLHNSIIQYEQSELFELIHYMT